MPPVRSAVHKIVIALFLGLVVSVVYLQGTAPSNEPPVDANVLVQTPPPPPPPPPVEERCGDGMCTASENCSSCADDCGECLQTFCCNAVSLSCDGPFGMTQTQNPCAAPGGYNPQVYPFAQGNDVQRQAAFQSCQTACSGVPNASCGNGIVEQGEECDQAGENTTMPNGLCRPDCRVARCGDTIIDTASGEACDDGNILDGDGCSGTCQIQ